LELGLSASVTDEERAIAAVAITRAEQAVRRHLKYDPVRRTRTEIYPQMDFDYTGRSAVWEVEGTQAVLRRQAEAATNELQVRHVPIRSITTLHIDYDGRAGTRAGSFDASTLKVEGTDYWANYDGLDSAGDRFCLDGIIRSVGAWPTTPNTVQIVYVAGYSRDELHGQVAVPDAGPIGEAVLEEACRRTKRAMVRKKQTAIPAGWVAGIITSEKMGDYSYNVDPAMAKALFGSQHDLTPESKEKLADFVNYGWVLAS
jgi:hypothetical protein